MAVKRPGLLFVLFLLLAFPSAAAQKVVKESFPSHNRQRIYYLYVPAGLKAPAPLIVLLHGSGHNGISTCHSSFSTA
jgi:poly(3-hydroxybutyrate) depolymerase